MGEIVAEPWDGREETRIPPHTVDVRRAPDDNWTHSVAVQRIQHFRELKDNWDSYGAKAPTEAAIDVARFMAVVPTCDGGLQFEWHANGWDVEVEVGPDGDVTSVYTEKR